MRGMRRATSCERSRSIACVGPAVPFPSWTWALTDPSDIPTACADGSSGVYGSTAANVVAFDRGFREPKSVRAAVDWSGPVLDNRVVLGMQGIVSNGFDQQGAVDINVRRTPSFTLTGEEARPVFADAAAIVPSTGTVSAGAGRVSAAFQSVVVERSDLAMRSRQFTVNLKPVTASGSLKWDFMYTWSRVREQFFGFASTTGDPFTTSWGTSLITPRHAVTLRWNDFPVFDLFYVTLTAQAVSGQRYTPMIARDVNGDGLQNDRAFIANPSTTRDQALASSMTALLRSASRSTRGCLEAQMGQLAERGSCQTPWTVTNLLQVKLNPQKLGLPRRATLSFNVANPLGMVDLALHGADAVRGWGQRVPPDENLLFVRGFDPATRRYTYEVNQRFGSTRPRESAAQSVPFLSLGVVIDLGISRERQVLTQRLSAGRDRPGTRANEETLKNLGTSSIPNPMAMIVSNRVKPEARFICRPSLPGLPARE